MPLKKFTKKSNRSSKIVVIHQPDFLPYLGFFHRFLYADLYVILDMVQFVSSNRSWHNRDKIKTHQGEKWLTVSVKKASRKIRINEVSLAESIDWKAKNINLIVQNYKKAPYFNEIIPHIEELYRFQCKKMVDFNLKSIKILMNLFDIKIETILSSELNPQGKGNTLLVDILKKMNASHYLSGIGAKDYYDPAPYTEADIQVVWQEFSHPVYPQQYGAFIPYLSSIDLLFNCGIEKSRRILSSI